MNSSLVLAILVVLSISGFAGDEPYPEARELICSQTGQSMHFQVAYARHFMESNGKTLSLRVSIGTQQKKTPDLLYRVGCAVAAKYRDEPSWQLLIFSDYKVAKDYAPPDSENNEPPEYVGACMGIHDAGKAHVKCGHW